MPENQMSLGGFAAIHARCAQGVGANLFRLTTEEAIALWKKATRHPDIRSRRRSGSGSVHPTSDTLRAMPTHHGIPNLVIDARRGSAMSRRHITWYWHDPERGSGSWMSRDRGYRWCRNALLTTDLRCYPHPATPDGYPVDVPARYRDAAEAIRAFRASR